jgi:hypothetical protein
MENESTVGTYEASETLLDKLAVRGVEAEVVERVDGNVLQLTFATAETLRLLATERIVRLLEGVGVAGLGEGSVDLRVFGGEVGLVEVVDVGHVGSVDGCRGRRISLNEEKGRMEESKERTLENEGSVRADEHSDGSSTTNRSRTTLSVDSDVTSDDNGVTTVPRARLDPVDSVEKGGGSSVASVLRVDTLDVRVAGEEVHEDGLDGLGLVDQGLGSDVETTDGRGRDLVLVEKGLGGCSRAQNPSVLIPRVIRRLLFRFLRLCSPPSSPSSSL